MADKVLRGRGTFTEWLVYRRTCPCFGCVSWRTYPDHCPKCWGATSGSGAKRCKCLEVEA